MDSLAPQLVTGNLRLTAGGVYADYLLSGAPFIFLSEDWQNSVAAHHAELWRTLPSGSSISGLTVPVPGRAVARRMGQSQGGTIGDKKTTVALAVGNLCGPTNR